MRICRLLPQTLVLPPPPREVSRNTKPPFCQLGDATEQERAFQLPTPTLTGPIRTSHPGSDQHGASCGVLSPPYCPHSCWSSTGLIKGRLPHSLMETTWERGTRGDDFPSPPRKQPWVSWVTPLGPSLTHIYRAARGSEWKFLEWVFTCAALCDLGLSELPSLSLFPHS